MIRLVFGIVLIGAVVFGLGWISDQTGDIVVRFRGQQYETTPVVAFVVVLAIVAALFILLWILGRLTRLPRDLRRRARARRERKGQEALARGLVAAGAGDARAARRASAEAVKHLGARPLTRLLEAQTALLAGDRDATEKSFRDMIEDPETRLLGLRGLHVEARRRGDADAAHAYAEQAHQIAPLAWAGEAVLDHHASRRDWTRALEAVDANLAKKVIDKPTAKRQRAVLNTAIALEIADRDPEEALRLASEAVSQAPDLVPATTLTGRLLGRRSDLRKASRLVEGAWRLGPHPDLAAVYLGLRSGDSSADRLKRAQTLARLAPGDPESGFVVARAAIAAREFAVARQAMQPLVSASLDNPPGARACAIMAEIEEAENGASGMVREWLARASRAPRDKAWVADGIVTDVWSPFSPVSGKLDAFAWRAPPQQLSGSWNPRSEPEPVAIAAPEPPAEFAAPVETPPPPPAVKEIAAPEPAARPLELVTAPDDPGPQRQARR